MAHLSDTFLQLIFNLVMLLLFVISVLQIYSLLMLSVQSKSFMQGIMRMVALSENILIGFVIIQSFMFVNPSIIVRALSVHISNVHSLHFHPLVLTFAIALVARLSA